ESLKHIFLNRGNLRFDVCVKLFASLCQKDLFPPTGAGASTPLEQASRFKPSDHPSDGSRIPIERVSKLVLLHTRLDMRGKNACQLSLSYARVPQFRIERCRDELTRAPHQVAWKAVQVGKGV